MSVRPRAPTAEEELKQGCCSRGCERLCEAVIAAVKRRKTRRAHRRLAEEAATDGLTAKRNVVTRTDGKPIGSVQMIAGDMTEISSIHVARPTPREWWAGKRLLSLRKEGVYVGTIEANVRRNQWHARPPIDTYSITSGGAGAPFDSELERGMRYALRYARN